MAENDQAGKDQPPSPNPLTFDDVERVADSFTPLWEAPAPVAPITAPTAAPAAPPTPAPVLGGGTQMLSTPAQVIAAPGGHGLPQAVPAPIPVEPRPLAPAPAAPAPQPAPATPAGNPLAKKTMLGMAPPPGVAAAFAAAVPAPVAPQAAPVAAVAIPAPVAAIAPPEPGPAQRRPSPIPEEAAPDSKSEYAPPRALPAAQRAVGMSPPISVDVPSRLGGASSQAAPAQSYYDPDDDSAKLDTIPPRRRQAGARRIVFGVMGVAIALVAAVGLRQFFQSKGADSGASGPARAEAVTAKPQAAPVAPAPPPSATTTEVAAAPPPPPEPEPAAPPNEAPEPDKAAVEAKPVAEATPRAARTPPHRAAPAPRPEKKQAAHTKEPRPVAAPPLPAPGGGSIVRESPF